MTRTTSMAHLCPNSTARGCRCPQHAPGVLERAAELARTPAQAAQVASLHQRLETTRLHVVTMPHHREVPCDGTMLCSCKRCTAQRAALVQRGARGSGARQPWNPKPAGRAA